MQLTAGDSVRDIISAHPRAARVFELLQIDTCCGPDQPLSDAAGTAGIAVDEVLDILQGNLITAPPEVIRDWSVAPLASLIDEIREHHRYTRNRLAWCDGVASSLAAGHGRAQPALVKLRRCIDDLIMELIPHLLYEERRVFPYIVAVEQGRPGEAESPIPGTPRFPLQIVAHTHSADSALLDQIRRDTAEYVAPRDSCESQQALYRQMEIFDYDLRHHIHLENDVLFPRAIAMEWVAAGLGPDGEGERGGAS